MCGIFGIWHRDGHPVDLVAVQRAVTTLRHRGPDDEGYLLINTRTGRVVPCGGRDTDSRLTLPSVEGFFSETFDLVLGSRRLAIIDLSPAGHQPMCNEDSTLWITYNGEIYNFQEIRGELQRCGHQFRSNTDTEVIIHAYEQWGAECLKKFNGMWAFCIWDTKNRKLFCARDRFGIKPFYYFFDGKRFCFASEIKALLKAGIERKPNERRVYDYLVGGLTDHTEETLFEGIYQLRGSHYLELELKQGSLKVQRYWDIDLTSKLLGLSDEEYAHRFYEIFEDAVRLHLISDVAVGTCLSGGLDSSSIVCMIHQLISRDQAKIVGTENIQKTFSARYHDLKHDEGRFIEEVIQSASVEAHQIYPTPQGLLEELEDLIYYQDEPFGSTSIFAQWCVFKLAAHAGVKVTLDGQGGDEILAGYHSYYTPLFAELIRSHRWAQLREELNSYALLHSYSKRKAIYQAIKCLLPRGLKSTLRTLLPRAGAPSWLNADFANTIPHDEVLSIAGASSSVSLFDHHLYYNLFVTSLPQLLRYADRNSMAHSIESRLPFLDYRLVQFLFSLPWEQKIRHGMTKYVLRNAMKGILPESVRTRPDKIAFSTPEDQWFRNELQDMVWSVIGSIGFKNRPYFDQKNVKDEFKAHCQGKKNLSTAIWRWVNLELWLRRFINE